MILTQVLDNEITRLTSIPGDLNMILMIYQDVPFHFDNNLLRCSNAKAEFYILLNVKVI